MGCNYWSLPEIPASGNNVHIYNIQWLSYNGKETSVHCKNTCQVSFALTQCSHHYIIYKEAGNMTVALKLQYMWHVYHTIHHDKISCLRICSTRARFTKGFWAHNPNFGKNHVVLTWYIMVWSGHNVAHVTAAQLRCANLWPDWIIRIKITAKWIFNYESINPLWNGRRTLVSGTSSHSGGLHAKHATLG